jgi:hypothetical protein
VFITSVQWIWGTTDQAIVYFDANILAFNGGFTGMMFKPSVGEYEYQPITNAIQLDANSIQVTMPLDATGINVDCSLQFDDGSVLFANGGKLAGIPTYNLIQNGGA